MVWVMPRAAKVEIMQSVVVAVGAGVENPARLLALEEITQSVAAVGAASLARPLRLAMAAPSLPRMEAPHHPETEVPSHPTAPLLPPLLPPT